MDIGIQRHFDAAHYLPNYSGRCSNLHGHTYKVQVRITGDFKSTPGGSESGMVIDFSSLKGLVDGVLDKVDHSCLNDKIPNPTAENTVKYLLDVLKPLLKQAGYSFYYLSVRVYESPDAWAEDMVDYE